MSFFSNPRRGGRHDAEPELFLASRTQATSLPKESPTTLLNITKLRTDSSLSVWGNEIRHVLRPFKLDALVDYDLPRPHTGDVNYNRWKFWTLVIASWLFNQVDASLQLKVKAHSNDLTFADEIFNTIRLLSLHSQSKFLAKELKRWEEIKREEFTTPVDFIMAYQNQFNRLKTEDHEPSCDFALIRLLQELHGEVLKVPFIQEEVKNLGRPVDYQLFIYYCKVLVAESRKPSVSATEDLTRGVYGEARDRSQSRGRDISYRGWRQSTKGRGPAWE
ncbi:putative transposable element [Penicillium digitatum]|uniref:Uncharacterized protein n=2 Tax=Penicillium digitatum TaxID=36651 RepID=K9FX94_PEND2|nr:hypothetical protein PDIG_33610 [Penicillium digitatum PHI26]KAG0156076.1 hypothetical protein PDIDSM_3252 [Penicillium digitatum]QQK43122.1 putative transposable element [Penicillium digitatum]